MAALPDARPLSKAQGLRLSLAAAAAAALAGCGGVPYASSDAVFPGSFEQRHPIVVAAAPTSVDLYPVGGRLDGRSRANVRAFADRYRRYGSGAVMIQTPVGTNPNSIAVYEVRRALLRAGVRGGIAVGDYLPRTIAQLLRCACRSRGSRRSSRRHAVSGRRISLRGHRSKDGRTNPTPTSAAPPNRRSRPRSMTRAISSSRAQSARPMSPCAPEPSRPSATAKIRAPSGRTPFSRQSAAICRPTDSD